MREVPLQGVGGAWPNPKEEARMAWRFEHWPHRGTSLIRKRPPPWDPPRTLGVAYGRVLGVRIFLEVRYPYRV